MGKVLLLNPPGDKIFVRDGYCSKVSKATYINPPSDLVIQSGILSTNHEVFLIDAIVDNISFDETEKKILDLKPDAILMLTGAVSVKSDFDFIQKIKQKIETKIIISGDIVREDAAGLLNKYTFIDACLLAFISKNSLFFINGDDGPFVDLTYRDKKNNIVVAKEENTNTFSLPCPRHDLFVQHPYHFPFALNTPMTLFINDFGCPFKCNFCIYTKFGYKFRPLLEIKEEFNFIKSLKIKEIYISDNTFGVNKKYTYDFLEIMAPFKFTWSCYSRVDVVDEQLLSAMHNAGCHTIIFGVESGNDDILKKYQKGFNTKEVLEKFKLCRKIGIRTVATFIIGLPGEDEKACRNTINFALKLDPDFASFNLAVPRESTQLRKDALSNKWLKGEHDIIDQSGKSPILDTPELSGEKAWELRNLAEKQFYGRLSYILKRLFRIRTMYEFRNHAREALSLAKNRIYKI